MRKTNRILHDYNDGSILIDISTKRYPHRTSRMDLEDFVKIDGRISLDNRGYPVTKVDGKKENVHRLVMPNPPEGHEVDHEDRDKCDNRKCKLRYVTHRENMQNLSNNTSGVPGVSWYEKNQKWVVRVRINGVKRYLGSFTDIEDAKIARRAAEALIAD